jgi:hypothetical protein
MYKIIGADQKEYGPITPEQLRQWISEGRVNRETRVQVEGSGAWKYLSELPEFAVAAPGLIAPVITQTLPMAPMAPAGPKGNPLALWAMVSGIFSLLCCQVIGPVSIVLGIVALSKIKQNPQETGSGFAITGIVLGILALVILVIAIFSYLPQLQETIQNNLH